MRYYIHEFTNRSNNKISIGKAREDVNAILCSIGFHPIKIPVRKHGGIYKILRQFLAVRDWNRELRRLKSGDILLIQYPPIENTLFLRSVLHKKKQNGLKIILLVHDVWIVHKNQTWRRRIFASLEYKVFNNSNYIIVHNRFMKKKFEREGIEEEKLIELGIFDYIIPESTFKISCEIVHLRTQPIIIAGDLRKWKAAYLADLPDNCEFNLYGIGFDESPKPNIHYQGSFMSDLLPQEMHGSFGLVWDGGSAETCSGMTGEYLRYNNPHKASLYLACGIPVIIWEQAAIAGFILENKCGFTVNSLHEMARIIECMPDYEYEEMRRNAKKMGQMLREGWFLRRAVKCFE